MAQQGGTAESSASGAITRKYANAANATMSSSKVPERLAVMAERLSEIDDVGPAPPRDPEVFEARVTRLIADHVEPARVKALDELGEGRRAMSIAMRWLNPKFG